MIGLREYPVKREDVRRYIEYIYSRFPLLDINISYFIFARRISCSLRDPRYKIKATYNYLRRELILFAPLISSISDSKYILIFPVQCNTFDDYYNRVVGSIPASFDKIKDNLFETTTLSPQEIKVETVRHWLEIYDNAIKNL